MRPRIQKGNTKLGSVSNVSLPPVKTCLNGAPCAEAGECYALKAWRQYPNVRACWSHNLECYRTDSELYFDTVAEYCRRRSVRLFRWHSAGDCPDAAYLDGVIRVASECAETRFLLFTKRYAFLYGRLDAIADVPNLSVVLSAWPGLEITSELTDRFPVAWMQDGSEDRVPEDAIECHGGCDACGMCWSLSEIGRDVVFAKH
jgi:hypothetical protein